MKIYPVCNLNDIKWTMMNKTGYSLTSIAYLPKSYMTWKGEKVRVKDMNDLHDYYGKDTEILLDNGMFTFAKKGVEIDNRTVFEKVKKFKPDYILPVDHPVNLSDLSLKQKERNIEKTISSVRDYIDNYQTEFTQPVAVIQALDTHQAVEIAETYKDLGYDHVAIGTMGRTITKKLLRQIYHVNQIDLELHVLGAAPFKMLPVFNQIVDSADQSSATYSSFTGKIINYRDLKEYRIYDELYDPEDFEIVNEYQARGNNYTTLQLTDEWLELWECDCLVCSEYDMRKRVLQVTLRDGTFGSPRSEDLRMLHFHEMAKKKALEPLSPEHKDLLSQLREYDRKQLTLEECF